MPTDLAREARHLTRPFRVERGKGFRLKDFAPDDTAGLAGLKRRAGALLEHGIAQLTRLQDKLYAQDRWSLLLVFQAMDAAGKDSTIKHVMSGVNPQGVEVHSFKQPSEEELGHDFLWRASCRLPARGRIGIFNRSYYEEVLVVRVHRELLERERLPAALVRKRIWEDRFEAIHAFERHLARNGTVVLKFFLHVSKKEQRKRFLERIDTPDKNWKFSMSDVQERQYFREYMDAYEDAIRNTATPHAPWYVVPADHKWFSRLVVAAAVVEALEDLHLDYPPVGADKKEELRLARAALVGGDGAGSPSEPSGT
jgi:PPK2 family polyphosphate:nucleotide phosphotransferase